MTRFIVRLALPMMGVLAVACCKAGGGEAGTTTTPVPAPASSCAGRQVVKLRTDDGVQLEADLHGPAGAARGAVVLLHMIPPHHDRSGYPDSFIGALVAKGFVVLNVDRRGAGKSQGVAEQAYKGPQGKLDAKAAVDLLRSAPCSVPADQIAFVGASNGTTTALDFALFATTPEGAAAQVAKPRALVFMTGGKYTEAQHKIADNRAVLDTVPILFMFSKKERAWSAGFRSGAASKWRFKQYEPGDHGTKMFALQSAAATEIASFLDDPGSGEAAPPKGDEARWLGKWTSAGCGKRGYARQLTLAAGGNASGLDLVSPCPAGVQCVWSGIVAWEGSWSTQGDGVSLSVAAKAHGKAVELPKALSWNVDVGAPAEAGSEPGCVYQHAK